MALPAATRRSGISYVLERNFRDLQNESPGFLRNLPDAHLSSTLYFIRKQSEDPLHVAIGKKENHKVRLLLQTEIEEGKVYEAVGPLLVTTMKKLDRDVVSIVMGYLQPQTNLRNQYYKVHCFDGGTGTMVRESQEMRLSAIAFSTVLCHFEKGPEREEIQSLLLQSGSPALKEKQWLNLRIKLARTSVRGEAMLSDPTTRVMSLLDLPHLVLGEVKKDIYLEVEQEQEVSRELHQAVWHTQEEEKE